LFIKVIYIKSLKKTATTYFAKSLSQHFLSQIYLELVVVGSGVTVAKVHHAVALFTRDRRLTSTLTSSSASTCWSPVEPGKIVEGTRAVAYEGGGGYRSWRRWTRGGGGGGCLPLALLKTAQRGGDDVDSGGVDREVPMW
jgi:hypothetical protein